ncbi:MAG: UvrD-helicase domain-containing protein, partial [Akkermansia sp.]
MNTPYVSGNVIAASAGTGKTYSLSSRYLALMALGADPAAMVALTFTRKAAGEFCSRIFHDLAAGAAEKPAPGKRNALAARLMETLSGLSLVIDGDTWSTRPASNPVALLPTTEYAPGADALMEEACRRHRENPQSCVYPEDLCRELLRLPHNLDADYFCRLLEKLVRSMRRLTLCTMDSFFQRLVTANSPELGISAVTPITGEDEERARREGIRAMLAAATTEGSGFYQLYSDVAGESSNKMMQKLEEKLLRYRSLYHRFPREAQWSGAAFEPLEIPSERRDAMLKSKRSDNTRSELEKDFLHLVNTPQRTQSLYRLLQQYEEAYHNSILSEREEEMENTK